LKIAIHVTAFLCVFFGISITAFGNYERVECSNEKGYSLTVFYTPKPIVTLPVENNQWVMRGDKVTFIFAARVPSRKKTLTFSLPVPEDQIKRVLEHALPKYQMADCNYQMSARLAVEKNFSVSCHSIKTTSFENVQDALGFSQMEKDVLTNLKCR
jgi:hypothetical protein